MITQMQTEYLNRLDGWFMSRKFKSLGARASRLAKAALRKKRSAYWAWCRRQYFLLAAYRDMKISIGRNEDIFIAVGVIAVALGFAYAVTAAELAISFFLTAYTISELSGANILIFSTIAAGTLAVTTAWVAAFLFNSMAIAMMQGANRKKIRSVKHTLRQGLRLASRTAAYWLMLLSTIALPVVLVAILMLAYLLIFVNSQAEALAALPYGIIAAGVGSVFVILSYSLVPVVALFEPKLSYAEVFARSRELVSRRGRVFIMSAYGLLAAILAAAYGLSVMLQSLIDLNKALTFSLVAIPAIVYFNGIMTMLYRKRRLARLR